MLRARWRGAGAWKGSCLPARLETVQHLTVARLWGSYTVVEEGESYKVKQIEVLPGSRLSLQMHQHRAEHWVVWSRVPRR